MNPLRKLLDSIEPKVRNNKFAHTVYDGLETFLFQPNTTTSVGTHIKDGMDLKRTMVHVVIALQLCYVLGTYNIGHQHYLALGMYSGLFEGFFLKLMYGLLQLLPIFVVVHLVGLGIEFFFAARKGHSIEEGFLVSGALIPLIMPPDIPLWMVGMATGFAVLIAKEAFGGTGMNILNIALVSRVFVFFAYPGEISGDICWVSYDYNIFHQIFGIEAHTLAFHGWDKLPAKVNEIMVDGFSGATPLALAASGGWEAVQSATLPNGDQQYSIANLLFGILPGSIGETSKVFVIAGAGLMIAAGIASWRIMLSFVLGAAFAGILMNVLHVTAFPDSAFIGVPWYHQFLIGSLLFAMAFMATDPVTAASTNQGKLIYGFMIGVLGMIIRVLNPAYPEGWMLAILFMNIFAPLIDYYVLKSNINRRLSRVA
ncbi:MAG: NADH:ubiquinone reductase (Na(+)-transporting) subunit B [Chitinophagales bacterium]|nr:NADH:ubiquinone reductase (Na(+)-transporting) subunit B [Chitinophagales bacterium]